MLLLLALSTTVQAAPVWFFPGRGPERVEIDARSRIHGTPVRRTGALLLRHDDPTSLVALPEVGRIEVLGGDGHVARIWPSPGVDEIVLSRTLHDRDDVAWAHPDLALPLTLHSLPDDPYRADQWFLENTGQTGGTPGVDIDAATAWAFATGAGQLVAVLDSGVDGAHPDLDAEVGWDYVDGDSDGSPTDNAHGTSCAGIAAGIGDNGIGVTGVAWNAQVYGIRLIGGETSLGDLYDAFVEAVDAGAGVLNNSWGFDNGCADFPTYGTLEDALLYAEEEGRDGLGSVVVFAAGNGDCDISDDGLQAYPTVFSVAASDARDVREYYSSYGPWVDVAAPSGNIVTTDISGDGGYGDHQGDVDYYSYFSGTSAAAPVVSGIVALMLEANPRLTAAQVREVLCQTAEPIDLDGQGTGGDAYDADGWSPWYGCGRVDAGAAVAAVANVAPDAPVILSPVDGATADRVLVRWDGGDADGDPLTWRVRWSVDGEDVVEEDVADHGLDLTGLVAAGEELTVTVAAVDLWGEGPESAPVVITVDAAPTPPVAEDPGSCAAVAPVSGLLGLALPLLAVLRRRR